MHIPESYRPLEGGKPISWEKIFENWKTDEENQALWQQHWQERGYPSWQAWRSTFCQELTPQKLTWYLYKLPHPSKVAPKLYGVPTKTWQERFYNGKTTVQLAELQANPEITSNKKIGELRNNFPPTTTLIGIISDEKIVLIEGQHRALALATSAEKIDAQTEVSIALSGWNGPLPILGGTKRS